MTVKFDKLAEGLGLNEETKTQITEAWTAQISEARQEITAELREEFAQRFEHDKATLVKSMNTFLNERVHAEIEEFAQDKKALAEERVKNKTSLRKYITMLEQFITDRMSKEVRELREDRERSTKNLNKLEEFVLKQLAEEVKEFHTDKQALVEQRVKLVRENKQTLDQTKKTFVKQAANIINENLNGVIRKEIKQYRQDIDDARKNDFGRRMFEAFVGEYMTSHLNESSEVRKLQTQIDTLATQLSESKTQQEKKVRLLEAAELRVRAANDRIGREKALTELLSPLGKRQRALMEELLENVKTANLRESFNKYLPAVLNENNTHSNTKQPLREGVRKVHTGNRPLSEAQQADNREDEIEMNQLRKLAGINSQK